MPATFCPNCKATDLATDFTSGRVECQECGYIVEENILVSEVGFAEGAGGRVHVQGAFVSHHATGIGGLRGRNSIASTENIKSQGQVRIALVAGHMGLGHAVRQGAQRLFALAVDSNFHRGRRKDYVVASCLYLQSRLRQEPHMLIDFSERLQINVFELGGTYLKLRATLHLTDPMPMTDPAVYSLRFANRLDLGNDRHKVATDASRLVRRFQADWMSEGRRPAGVCGACLLVAARMNGHHRTPEEIAQIVKVSPTTIKRRLLEFAQTDMAEKTVEQWKSMTDADLSAPGEMQPPVVKQQEARDAKRRKFNDGITKLKSSKSKSRSRSIRARSQSRAQEEEEEEEEQSDEEGRELRKQVKQSQMKDAIQAAVAQLEGEEDEDEEETDLAPPAPDQYVRDLDAAGDNPEIAQNERVKAMKKFKRFNKVASSGQEEELEDLEDLEEDLEDLAEGEKEDEAVVEGDEEDGVDKEEKRDGAEADVDDPRLKLVKFDNWDDPEAVRKHVEEKYMPKVRHESALTDKHMEDRLSLWMGVRDPKQVMYEFEVVNRALRARDKAAKGPGETEFDDVDDEEIDRIWMMEENEQRTRARMWLSHNGKWLEEDKEKQWKREQYEINNADKIQRRKQKRKQRPMKRNQPYNTPREAMEGFMAEKNFSSRLNLAALKELGLDPGDGGGGGPSYGFDGLQAMDEKDDDGDEKDDDNEKYEPGASYNYGQEYDGGEVGADYAEYD